MNPQNTNDTQVIKRVRIWYGLLIFILMLFGLRLFYIQVIRHEHYKAAALSDQLKEYQIPATRGTIYAYDGRSTLPIVLNQEQYTVFADPVYIKDADVVANKLVTIIGGYASDYAKQLKTKDTRYVVLAKRLNKDQQGKILALKYPGLGIIANSARTYPQGTIAAQTLGFVNADGDGEYGIEQALNKTLSGTPGELKAITDVHGIPLAASKDNIDRSPKDGSDVVLTLDLSMQHELESVLKQSADVTHADITSALILNPYTGAIKAMANYPTYDPSEYYKVKDPSLFSNAAVADALEPGSITKILTTASAINQGVIKPDQTYYDPAKWVIDGHTISNVEQDGGPGTRSLGELLNLSLNTGATWELMQMGGGQINTKARNAWYSYLTDHFMLGQLTGIEQGYESAGYVPGPKDNGAAIDLTYANMSFGQAYSATAVQMAAALASVINGGTYYQPHLVDRVIDQNGNTTTTKTKVVKSNVVDPKVSQDMITLMEYVITHRILIPPFDETHYIVGGKTGTAQVAQPGGGYYSDRYNGTYYGFVGGDKPQYVIAVYIQHPRNGGYAGAAAAQPVFVKLAHWLIDDSYVLPKS